MLSNRVDTSFNEHMTASFLFRSSRVMTIDVASGS